MDYDFSGLCADQLEKIRIRLERLNKQCIEEYNLALNVINSQNQLPYRSEIMIDVQDHLQDVVGKCEIFYTEAMNKVQTELRKFL